MVDSVPHHWCFHATVRHEEISIDVTPDQIFFRKIFGMGASIVAKMMKSDWLKKYQFFDRIFHRSQN
jgi:hypothetical protein